jgi:hypothetical protein
MATKHNDDDFDFPDRPVEPDPPPKVFVQAEDLHLGAATVRPLGRSWAEQHGPQPPGTGMRALDFLIIAMFAGSVLLFIKACSWALFS